ncbi:hypothetical protein HDV03_002514 [Kappamyces sp. JEL0829]|nr:hypothetical protein HDV03_002514 [Kappamyces sp. JEL0829]
MIIHAHCPRAVPLFFILSGRVLTIGALRKNSYPAVASAVFRRPFRLVLPVMGAIVYYKFVSLFLPGTDFERGTMKNAWELLVVPAGYILLDGPWIRKVIPGPCWTLKHEWYGSLATYLLTILLISQTKQSSKYLILVACLFFTIAWNSWTSHFIVGLLLAEASQSGLIDRLKSWRWMKLANYVLLALVIYLFAITRYTYGQAFHQWLAPYIINPATSSSVQSIPFYYASHQRLFLCSGVMLFIELSDEAQYLLATRIPRYLGRISFSLYILHDSYHQIGGQWIFESLGGFEVVNKNPFWHILIPTLFYIPLAELFTRYVELPTVTWARKLESQLLEGTPDLADARPMLDPRAIGQNFKTLYEKMV